MRTRLLPLLIVLMAAVLLALGFPLAVRVAAAEQQRVVIDRIDDTARFGALAQFVDEPVRATDERQRILQTELEAYDSVYGIRAGVFYRDDRALAKAPGSWILPAEGEGREAFKEALLGRRSHDPSQVWPWQDGRIVVASPVVRDGDVVAVVVTDSPTGDMRSRTLRGWLLIALGEALAMLVAVGAAFRLTGWVLLPVRVLDAATHDIASGRMRSRVAASGGPPELRRLARSFNEMADNVEDVLEQQRAFVADASHQLRNPLAALLLRIELLALELPDGNEEIASVRTEGKRLAQVLDDLLDLALAEHTEADLQLTDIAALAGERVASWRPLAEEKGVRLTLDGAPAVTGWADPIALSSALDAVIDNALKFTPEGQEVRVTAGSDGEGATVVVADRGPGLTEQELERVGDRFWRSGRHQNIKGSGLGLSISRALLAAGGGSIRYGTHEPHGLRVTVTVPRHPRTREPHGSGLGRAVVAPGALVQRQRIGVDGRPQVHQLRGVHLAADPVPAVDHGPGERLGRQRIRTVRGDQQIRHRDRRHGLSLLRLRVGVGRHHGRAVVARGPADGLELGDQRLLQRHQPDRELLREALHGGGRQPAGPEERVETAVRQPLRHRVDPRLHGSDVRGRIDSRRPHQPVRDEKHARPLLSHTHPLAPQIGDLADPGVPGHHQLDVVVVQPHAAAQPAGARFPALQIGGDRVGGGDGEVGLARRDPFDVLLGALAGPQPYRHLRHVLGQRTLQPLPVALVDPAPYAGGERERTARLPASEREHPPQQQSEHDHGGGAP